MFNKFWENKKFLIEVIGILCGVGALFLSITSPVNEKAQVALANIQFVWLILITISLVFLFFTFVMFSVELEERIKAEHELDITQTLSVATFFVAFYMIYNLWVYVLNLYVNSAKDFLKTFNFGIGSILGSLHFVFWRQLVLKIPEIPKYKRISFSIFSHTLFAFILGAWVEFVTSFSAFTVSGWLKHSGTLFVVLVFIAIILTLVDKIRKKV